MFILQTCLLLDFCLTLDKNQTSWPCNPENSKRWDIAYESSCCFHHKQIKHTCSAIDRHIKGSKWCINEMNIEPNLKKKIQNKQNWPCFRDCLTKGWKERGTHAALNIIHKMIQRVKTLNWCLAQLRRRILFQTRQSLPSPREIEMGKRVKSKVSGSGKTQTERKHAKKEGETKSKGFIFS